MPYSTDNAASHLLSGFTFKNLRHDKPLFSVTSRVSSQLTLSKSTPSFILRNGRTNCPKYFEINIVPPFVKALQLLIHSILSKIWANA